MPRLFRLDSPSKGRRRGSSPNIFAIDESRNVKYYILVN